MTKTRKKLTEQQSKNRPSVLQSDQHFPIRTDKHTKKIRLRQTCIYVLSLPLKNTGKTDSLTEIKKNPVKTTHTRPILGLYTTVPPPTLCA